MWQALTVSVILAVVLAGLALAFPALPASASLAEVIKACTMGLRQRYQTPGGLGVAVIGGVTSAGILIRVGYCLAAGFRRTRRSRIAQHQVLDIAARHDAPRRVTVIEHSTPTAYCIPGRPPKVVFSTAAMAVLDDAQIGAVLAHERAHLRGRHNVVLAMFGALRDAFPRVTSIRMARTEVAQLLEMRADDVALRSTDRLALANALVDLSHGAVPAGAVSATGSALARLERIALPRRPLTLLGRMSIAMMATVLVVAPLFIAVEPAVAASALPFCPIAG